MLVSHRHRFIFVHVYKAAGSSVSDALAPFAHDGRIYGIRNKHLTAAQIRARFPFPLFFDRYFRFAFVRNPWSLEASLYNFARRKGELPQGQTFEAFLEGRRDRRSTKGPQAKFVIDGDGRTIVNHVGRMERIEEEFAGICRRIGFTERDRPQLAHANRSTFDDWRSYYTPRTRAMVAEMSARDIEMFGYSFEEGP
jgi:hypothetical protein